MQQFAEKVAIRRRDRQTYVRSIEFYDVGVVQAVTFAYIIY